MMAVAKYLKENESGLKRLFLLAGVADEERGSALGMEYLLDECGIHADYAIIPDVANNMQMIDVTEKGALFLEITSFGKQAHGSTPERGINAVWNMIAFLKPNQALQIQTCLSSIAFPSNNESGIDPWRNGSKYGACHLQGANRPALFAGRFAY